MLKVKRLSEVIGKRVFTDSGELFGLVEEINLVDNRIEGWRIVVSRESGMSSLLGGARGIIVPQQFLKAIGDVVVISRNAVPVQSSEDDDISLDDQETAM
jgi:sporulation protein YlmC with PRC-barrel domain